MLSARGPANMALAAFRIKKFNVPAGGGRCTYRHCVCRALLPAAACLRAQLLLLDLFHHQRTRNMYNVL